LVAAQPVLRSKVATAASHTIRTCCFEVFIRRSPVV
jgi:hypothetical protein